MSFAFGSLGTRPSTMPLLLADNYIKAFKVAAVPSFEIPPNHPHGTDAEDLDDRINAVDISYDGEVCVTSSDNNLIHVYKTDQPPFLKKQICQHVDKYGCNAITFTHDTHYVLVADRMSTKAARTVRMMNVETEEYVNAYCPHGADVHTIAIHPNENTFLTCDYSGAMRIFDLREKEAKAIMYTNSRHIKAEFSPDGMVFGAVHTEGKHRPRHSHEPSSQNYQINLFDMARYEPGPFITRNIQQSQLTKDPTRPMYPKSFHFCGSADYIAVAYANSRSCSVSIYDAFELEPMRDLDCSFKPIEQEQGEDVISTDEEIIMEARFSPDRNYLAVGLPDGSLKMWNIGIPYGMKAEDKNKYWPMLMADWHKHPTGITSVRWSPATALMITAGHGLCFWCCENET